MYEQQMATVFYFPMLKCLHSHFPGKLILKWKEKKIKIEKDGKGLQECTVSKSIIQLNNIKTCLMTQQFTCLVLNNSLNSDIAGSHSSAAEESGLVGCRGVSMGEPYLTFQRLVLPLSSGQAAQDASMFLCNAGNLSPNDEAPYPRRPKASTF